VRAGTARALTAAALALSLVVASAPAAAQAAPEEALVVTLDEDGSAEVALRLVFDLADEDRRDAFRALSDDAAARERRADAFERRMAGVADAVADTAGRTTGVGNASVDLRTVGETGVVELSTTVDGLAAAGGDRLRVDAPFAGGVVTDRPLVLVSPEGYEPVAVEPAPDATDDDRLRWDAGRDLTGFEAAFEPSSGSDGRAPGFGVVVALVALVGAGAVVLRRDR
jgi:PGF-CTERM protein